MNNWQKSLDRYLTTDHSGDHWIEFYETVANKHNEEFWEENEDWILDSDTYNDLLNSTYAKGYSPTKAANIIERAHSLYKL